ncbi:hypothetical protein [Nostoc sp.]|uniref:hypothetical protein n=1 Tax=Nostoc sp. TaxID=1180 RepID=UPI002FFBCDE4
MQYCNIEDQKATITWSWDNGATFKQYFSQVVPVVVNIEATAIDGTNVTGTWTLDTYDDITSSYIFSYRGDSADSPVFNNRTITSAKDGRVLSSDPNDSAGLVRARDIKFTPDSIGGYKIIISTVSGTKLYEDKKTIDHPPIYEVACGDNCPKGSHKCTHNKYPGYCCVPCKQVGDRLKNIASKVGK